MKEYFKDLFERPTLVSTMGTISFFLLLVTTIYMVLFVNLNGGGSLGVALLLIV